MKTVDLSLFTGNWKRAIAITLMVAVPIVCALLLGAILMRPTSTQDMLRSMPLFPGARHVEYSLPSESGTIGRGDHTGLVTYQVTEQPPTVVVFYLDTLTRDGWLIPDHSSIHADFTRTDYLFTGISFRAQAPWITLEHNDATRVGYVKAERATQNGQAVTEVTLELTPDAGSGLVFIP